MKHLLLFLLYSLLHVAIQVQAERQSLVEVPPQLLHIGSVSPPIFGTIDGEGYLDFANVSFNFDWDGPGLPTTIPPTTTPPAEGYYYSFVEPTTLKLIGITTVVKDHPREDDTQITNSFIAEQQQQTNGNSTDSASAEDNTMKLHNYLANKLGIGAFSPSDGHYYACCDLDAKKAGACTPNNNEALMLDVWNYSQWGSLILDPDKTNSIHTRHFEILPTVTSYPEIDLGGGGVLQMQFEAAGHLALVFANCAPGPNQLLEGEEPDPHTIHTKVHLQGTINFVSYVSLGTLPLYLALSAGHVVLAMWFGRLMTQNEESRIRVEGWIMWALVLAALAIIVKTVLFAMEVFGNDSYLTLQLCAAFAKSISHGVSRCVYLLVALGIGVVSHTPTQSAMNFLTVWLIMYIPSTLLLDLDFIYGEEPWMVSLTAIAINLFLFLNLLFMVWVPMAIRQTIAILKASNEPLKLQRYEWVWRIYLLAVMLTVAQIVMVITTSERQDLDLFFVQEEQKDVIYFVILACIAYLWRPNPGQQMYAYAMLDLAGQMPSSMDLELTQQESLEGRYDDDSENSYGERGPTATPPIV